MSTTLCTDTDVYIGKSLLSQKQDWLLALPPQRLAGNEIQRCACTRPQADTSASTLLFQQLGQM